VPENFTFKKVNSNAEVLYHTMIGNVLKVALPGQKEPLEWELVFSAIQK